MKAVKLAIAVVLFAAAAVLGVRAMSNNDDAADLPDQLSYFKCGDCGTTQSLNEADLLKVKKYLVRPDQPVATNQPAKRMLGVDRGRRELHVLQCTNPKCEHYAARVAIRCSKDGEIFIAQSDEGEPKSCPKCGGRPGG